MPLHRHKEEQAPAQPQYEQQGYQQPRDYQKPQDYPQLPVYWHTQGDFNQAPTSIGDANAQQQDSGAFPGGTWNITHRHSNTLLIINLEQGSAVRSRAGAMVHMATTVNLVGNLKFSFKNLLTGGEIAENTYTGYGPLTLSPRLFGDITTIHIDGSRQWLVGEPNYMACTQQIFKDTTPQRLGQGLFSGSSMFVFSVMGQGIVWLSTFGGAERTVLQPGEEHFVDHGHLVAWSCQYRIEKVGGSLMQSMKSGEGLLCRFTGPGTIYIQSRNLVHFEEFIYHNSAKG